jgi:hypothetical protein
MSAQKMAQYGRRSAFSSNLFSRERVSRRVLRNAAISSTVCLLTLAAGTWAIAAGPNVKGRIKGYEKLRVDVYAEAAKPESKRWAWREPSAAVDPQFQALSPTISREICIVATNTAQNPALPQPLAVAVTGGRTIPATLVVTPGTQLQFRNDDPFAHKLYIVGEQGWTGAMDTAGSTRDYKTPAGEKRIEIRDEYTPSLRMHIVVTAAAVQTTYPAKDGSFAFALPTGDYVLKAYFAGKRVGKEVGVAAKDKGSLELKELIDVSEGGDK